ncbi:S41 family peptidase [Henriciella pelagia]|uniref:Peptidase S41 n=1 Tax=Henriciella pelagia TaxID=1977912 RepID=A0ABQ1JV74_9PROT|nr:S41 family peptidase [Henriciella pelagia]GGB78796.1 peptidase S41 [Henriciella pelagia]
MPMNRPSAILASAILFGLAACGGGGGGGGGSSAPPAPPPPPSPPPSGGSGPTYTPGVYEDASLFKDQCETPRTGVDIEGNPFPDEAGSLLEELLWLRSWTDETYLWRTEVPDLDPDNYTARVPYFDDLKTSAVTASGEAKDDFHFSEPTEDYLAARNSAPSPAYGASYAILAATPPRDVRIRYVEPGSPAAEIVSGQQNLIRGTRLLSVDGIDIVNAASQAAVNQINAALFPDTVGESHTFTVSDPGTSATRTVTLSAANISRQPVIRTSVIPTATGDVGYIVFNTFSPFSSEKQIADAMQTLATAGVTDLVLDLRYNGGGLLAVASQLSYMIAGNSRTSNRTFELLRFNAAAGNINPVTGEVNSPIPFYRTGLGFSLTNGASLPTLDLGRVYILSTGSTCSASEAVINGLRGIDVEVVLIGDITCGKPYGFYPQDNCGQTYYTIQFQGVNDKNFGDFADGFVPANSSFAFGVETPGCVVRDDFQNQLGDTSEALLAAALQYRSDGTCPALPPGASADPSGEKGTASAPDETLGARLELPEPDVLENNMDLSMPGDYRGRSQ